MALISATKLTVEFENLGKIVFLPCLTCRLRWHSGRGSKEIVTSLRNVKGMPIWWHHSNQGAQEVAVLKLYAGVMCNAAHISDYDCGIL